MYIEKRKLGKSIKYYLVHSYRDKDNIVKKIRKYMGSNLNKKEIEKLKQEYKEIVMQQIEKLKTEIFDFSLSEKEIEQLNKQNNKIDVHHLDKKEWARFTENFVYNTNAIEGSTLQKDEVHDALKKERTKNPEELEAKGVAKAIEFIKTTKQDISLPLIKKLHKLCFKETKSFAGKFRDVEVIIKNAIGSIVHRGTPAKELEDSLKEYVSWYKKNKNVFKPLVLAAIMHNQFEDIHPFQDGNGRVGRLILNFILLKNKYPPINILLEDRSEYYNSLQRYSKKNDLKTTLKFLVKQYKKTLKQVTTKNKKV